MTPPYRRMWETLKSGGPIGADNCGAVKDELVHKTRKIPVSEETGISKLREQTLRRSSTIRVLLA